MKRTEIVLVLTVFLSICFTTFASASYAQQRTLLDGVYTDAQVTAGEDVYESSCNACHDLKFYRAMWKVWVDKPLMNFWYTIVAEMPSDNPGSLMDTEYTNILANILSEMGFPSGDTELDPNKGMDQITIVMP